MKKKRLAVMCAVLLLLLSGCTAARSSADHDDRGDTTSTTTSPPVQGEVDETAQAFMDALCDGDAAVLRRFTQTEETAALLASVRVSDYVLEATGEDNLSRLTLAVSESRVPSIPAGRSEWLVETAEMSETFSVRLRPYDPETTTYWLDWLPDAPAAVAFCFVMGTDLEMMETVPDCASLPVSWVQGRGGDLLCAHNRLSKMNGGETPSQMATAELAAFAKQVLGVSVDTFTAPALDEQGMVNLMRYGGLWYSATLAGYEQEGNRHTVTVRYHADATALVEAKTVRYVAEENNGTFRLLSVEKLSETEYIPLWIIG